MTRSGAQAISASTSGYAPSRLGSRLRFAATSAKRSELGAKLMSLDLRLTARGAAASVEAW
jgi:hypothetical protein